jgi:hypothetical protein
MVGRTGSHPIQQLYKGMAIWSQDDPGNDGITGFLVFAGELIVPVFKERGSDYYDRGTWPGARWYRRMKGWKPYLDISYPKLLLIGICVKELRL